MECRASSEAAVGTWAWLRIRDFGALKALGAWGLGKFRMFKL